MTLEPHATPSRSNKAAIIGLAVTLAAISAAYFASPVAALYALKSAVHSGNKDRLDALVDFPAVRDDLKAQVNARTVQAMSQPDMKDNPIAGLAALMVPALIGRMVDTVVTPDGISALIHDGKIEQVSDRPRPASTPRAGDPTVKGMGYLTLDRFKVTLDSAGTPPSPMSLVLKRRGVFTWKLIKIELPADAFPANSGASPVATEAASNAQDNADRQAGATETEGPISLFAKSAAEPPGTAVQRYSGPKTKIDFSGPNSEFSDFRTRIREAAAEGPNFAGQYSLGRAGCGAGCTINWVTNVATGRIYDLGIGGEDYYVLTLHFSADSTFLKAIWMDQSANQCIGQGYIWVGDHLRPMGARTVEAPKDYNCPDFGD